MKIYVRAGEKYLYIEDGAVYTLDGRLSKYDADTVLYLAERIVKVHEKENSMNIFAYEYFGKYLENEYFVGFRVEKINCMFLVHNLWCASDDMEKNIIQSAFRNTIYDFNYLILMVLE